MPVTMIYKEWRQLTKGDWIQPCSRALQEVDRAFRTFEKTRLIGAQSQLRHRLQEWMATKNGAWKSSVRNHRNAVESLYLQLTRIPPAVHAPAVAAMEAETDKLLRKLFQGARLTWRGEYSRAFQQEARVRLKLTRGLVESPGVAYNNAGNNKIGLLEGVGGTALNAASVLQAAQNPRGSGGGLGFLISTVKDAVVPRAAQGEVIAGIRVVYPNFEKELVAAVIPFLGLGTAAVSTVASYSIAFKRELDSQAVERHGNRVYAGTTPKMGIDAMIKILDRERNAELIAGSLGLAELGGKLASLLADGGIATNPAVGLAGSLMRLMNIMRIIYRDIKERDAANAAIKAGVSLEIFNTSPLVGCYFIACAPTSVVMDQIIGRIGQPGWMDLVERNRKHLIPLKERAVALIHESRFEIRSLAKRPALVAPNKSKLHWMKWKPQNTTWDTHGRCGAVQPSTYGRRARLNRTGRQQHLQLAA
ncbi:MAG: hypothetical protein AAF667_07200 [Pseudomonadota bacterium]